MRPSSRRGARPRTRSSISMKPSPAADRARFAPMNASESPALSLTRREFFSRTATGIGAAALASLLDPRLLASGGVLGQPHFAPTAKRVIYLFMHGGPSQLDLFDHKPGLRALHGQELPASVRGGQRT